MSRRREVGLVALAISAFYLGTHASALPPRVLAPGDQLVRFAPFNELADPELRPKNVLLLDPILQFIPWQEFSRRELAAGRLPTWNPSGLGSVHLANDQAAVFSPFRWPVYLLGVWGLLLAGWAKSLVLGLGVFLFLRQQRLSARGAALGALATCASAPVLAWQLHPHTDAFAWVGWLLLTAELSAREPRLGRGTVGLALVTAATLCAGHLQTALHLALLVAAWLGVTAAGVGRERGAAAAALGIARPLGAALLGLGLAAPHVLPFLHALRQSPELAARAAGAGAVAPLSRLPLLLFPDLLGHPREGVIGPGAGHLELVPAYAGAGVASLGALGLLLRRSAPRPLQTCFGAVGLLALLVVFGVLDEALAAVPPFDVTRNHRLVFLAGLAVAVLGAAGFDAAARAGAEARPSLLNTTMWVGAGVFLAMVAALAADELTEPWRSSPAGRIGRSQQFAVVVPLLGAAGVLGLLRSRLPRRRIELGVIAIACAELFLFASDVAPGCARDEVAPPLPALAPLRGERVLCLGNAIPPNVGLHYGLRPTRAYDALGNRTAWARLDRLAPFTGPLRGAFQFDDAEADALAIRYVLTDDPLLAKNLRRGLGAWYPYQPRARGALLPIDERGVRHPFTLLHRVSVLALPEVRAARATEVRLRLLDAGGRLLRESRQRVPAGTHEVLFAFGPLGDPNQLQKVVLELSGDVAIARQDRTPTFLLADRVSRPYAPVETGWGRCWLLENPDARARAQPVGPGQARIVGEGGDWVEVEVEGVTRLRLADAWSPGWSATCDGAPAAVEEVDGLREVVVPPGTLRVRFDYRAPGLRLGALLALACALLLLGVAALSRRAGRGSPAPSR